PSKQGNAFSFPSTRTPGMTAEMDPDRSTGKYWRAIVANLDLPAGNVVGGGSTTPPDVTPGLPSVTSLSAPGVFSPNDDGRQDTFELNIHLSVPAAWQFSISAPDATVVSSTVGRGDVADIVW